MSVAVSPSGRDVYVAASNPGALVHFCVDQSTGEVEVVARGGNATVALALDGASWVSENRHHFLPFMVVRCNHHGQQVDRFSDAAVIRWLWIRGALASW